MAPKMISPRMVQLGDGRLPLDLRSVRVDEDGRLLARRRQRPLRFSFAWQGLRVAGRCDANRQATDGPASLRLAAELGRLPYRRDDAEAFAALGAIVTGARDVLTDAWGQPMLKITRGRRLLLATELELPAPATAVDLMAATVRVLTAAAPYLALIRRYSRKA